MENIKQIPYGVADFESVMGRNLYYVDKTMFLEELEKMPYTQIFIRPRRTIKGTRGSLMILGIPNNNVRMQYYNYILKQYNEYKIVNVNKLQISFVKMSLDGCWRDALQYMADCYKQLSSVRDSIEGERNIQGFFLAYLCLNDYYITAPEVELNHGYCDFFLLPNMTHYQANHSYILELKYISKAEYTEEKAEKQWAEAVEQINGYAVAPCVEALRQGTQMHKIIMQLCGWELVRMEEIE